MLQNNKDKIHIQRPRTKNKPHIIRVAVAIVFALCILLTISGAAIFFYYASTAPSINPNVMSMGNSTKVYDNSGHYITGLGTQSRNYIKYNQIPHQFVNALTSIEDRQFFTNNRGIDPLRILSAGLSNLRGNSLQGGSTITQQLVKLSVFSTAKSDQTMKRKAQEAWLAMKVDRKIPKQKIFEYYANKVYLGYNSYGVQTAANFYYGKPLNKLNLPQQALIAGMPQSPVLYDPYRRPQFATKRRNQVLQAMVANHKLNQQQASQAEKTPIKQGLAKSHAQFQQNMNHEHVIDSYLTAALDEAHTKKVPIKSGAKLYINVDLKDQQNLYNLANDSNKPGWPSKNFQVGAALVNAHNGNVVAMLGSRNQNQPFGLNRALQTSHSNGSTNKPMMDYGPAVQYQKMAPYTPVYDTPFVYPGTDIHLKDFDHAYQGKISARDALVRSRNIPAIRTLQSVGVPRAEKFMSSLGINLPPRKTTLQNGIGAYVSPLQEAAAYATFADGGIYHEPNLISRVVEPNGVTHYVKVNSHRAMSPQAAYIITDMLKGVLNDKETGSDAKIPGLYEAGKTGTTEYPGDYKGHLPSYAAMDAWFAGYTPNLSMAIWTGYDHPLKPGHYIDINGINIPLKLYKYAMANASRGWPNHDWRKPPHTNLW